MTKSGEYCWRSTFGNTSICLLCGRTINSGEKALVVNIDRAWGNAEYELCKSCAVDIAGFVDSTCTDQES